MSSPTTAATATPGKKPRVPFWDNARFALIVLVVIGHSLSTVRHDTDLAYGIYTYIYLFHMPALILLSGYFSRANTSTKTIRATVQLIVLWILWEGIWAAIDFAASDRTPGESFLVSPSWTLWFLVTLVTMRIVLPYIAQLRHPLIVSIGIALFGGAVPVINTDFSAARTLTFLPFFVAGWLAHDRGWLTGEWFAKPRRWVLVVSWGLLALVAATLLLIPNLQSFWGIDDWLTWRDGYAWRFENAPIGDWAPRQWLETTLGGVAVTAGLLALAAAMTFAVLGATPRRRLVTTDWGARTLSVYLLHGPIIWTLREVGVIDAIGEWGELGVAILVVGAAALASLLALAPVERAFRWILTPNVDWLLSRKRRDVRP